jgi:drug/metabolite transporter (DMT)-like permease
MKLSGPPTQTQIGLVLTLGIFAVSTAAVLVRLTLATVDQPSVGFSLVMAALRMLLAAIVLLPTWQTVYRSQPSPTAWQAAVGAGIALAVHFATWITSLSYTSIAASTAIVTTNPIWVTLIAWIWLQEKPSRFTLVGISLALAGGLVIASEGIQTDTPSTAWIGNGLALVGAWAASGYLLLGRAAQQRGLSVGGYIAIAYGVAAIILVPLPLLMGARYTGYAPLTYGYILLMAGVPQLVGHTSFNWAVRWVSPTLVTLVILLEPVGASILAALLFKELPGMPVLVGAIGLLLGVAIAVLNQPQIPPLKNLSKKPLSD